MTATHAMAAGGTNYTAISITLGILFIVGVVISSVVWSYVWLQARRTEAVAMAAYRKLAEEAVGNQSELRDQLATLTKHVNAVEQLMRDVG